MNEIVLIVNEIWIKKEFKFICRVRVQVIILIIVIWGMDLIFVGY